MPVDDKPIATTTRLRPAPNFPPQPAHVRRNVPCAVFETCLVAHEPNPSPPNAGEVFTTARHLYRHDVDHGDDYGMLRAVATFFE